MAIQEAISQRLLVPSLVSPWLEACDGNSGALEEEYISKWLVNGSPMRASVPDTFNSALLPNLSPK